jgi:predicted glycosyltransferase
MPGRRDDGSGCSPREIAENGDPGRRTAASAALNRRAGRASRFLFYSHDGLGLGHVRRNLSVASALTELAPRASVLVVTSVEEAESFGIPPNVDVLKLPGLRKLGNERYAARRLPVPWRDVRAVRAKLLAAAVESFRPAVLLADKHPLGVGGELVPALEAARASGARAILGLRDVLDEPAAVAAEWGRRRLFERVAEYYDRVLVYGQPDVLDPVREYGFPEGVAAITLFCGYVVSSADAPSRNGSRAATVWSAAPARPRVLATAGGGEDGFALLASFVEAAADKRWQATVVSGPQCRPAKERQLRGLADEAGAEFRRFVPGLSSAFGSLDALVCMGGYNTLLEAAASGVPTVCVPRVRPRREQLLRAQAFARLGLLRLLEPQHLDAPALRVEVESALGTNGDLAGRAERLLDLGGARRAACNLLELAGAEAAGPEPADAILVR